MKGFAWSMAKREGAGAKAGRSTPDAGPRDTANTEYWSGQAVDGPAHRPLMRHELKNRQKALNDPGLGDLPH
jgi:hypothetical protein